jgi:hypothetical protein
MNRKLFAGLMIVLTLVVGQKAHAQEGAFKIGVNVSSVTHADGSTIFGLPQSTKSISGFIAGFQYNMPVLEWLSIQPEVIYAQKGFQQKIAGATATVTQKIELGYVEIPLLLKFSLNKSFFAAAGPYYAFRVSDKLHSKEGTLSSETGLDSVKKNDKGWVAALGLILDDESGAFIEFRYTRSFQGVFEEPVEIVQKNSCFCFSLGYCF